MGDRVIERETVTDAPVEETGGATVEQKVTKVGHGHGEEVGGALAGGVAGAAVGSVVPGIGTAVGAVVGAATGAIAGKADEDQKGTIVEERTAVKR